MELLQLRTPRQDIQASLTQVLFGHATRSVTPIRNFKYCNLDHAGRKSRPTAVKHTYDKHARPLAPLHVLLRVLSQNSAKDGWAVVDIG